MITPLVSVIMPTCDRGESLENAIRSVFEQESEDWELIVIDDGEAEAKTFVPRNKKVRYVKNPRNMGAPESRNAGIALSRGEFIAYLDDDDEWYPTHLSVGPDTLREYDFLCSWTNTRKGGEIKPFYYKKFSYSRLAQYNFIPTPNVIHRRDILARSGTWNGRLPCLQDWDLWCRIALCTNRIHSRDLVTTLISWSERSITADTAGKRVRRRAMRRIKLKYFVPLILKGLLTKNVNA